jgi:ribosomal protein S5
MTNVSIKCHGSTNILTVIPAFFKCLDEAQTLEEYANAKGLIPIYATEKYKDYLENVRNNKKRYGWF